MVRVGDEPNWRRWRLENVDCIPKKDLEEYLGTSEHLKDHINELHRIANDLALSIERIKIVQIYCIDTI